MLFRLYLNAVENALICGDFTVVKLLAKLSSAASFCRTLWDRNRVGKGDEGDIAFISN